MDSQSGKHEIRNLHFYMIFTFFSDTYWGNKDASVICRMLGLNPGPGASSVALRYSSFGLVDIPNYNRTSVHCTGSEQSIYDCPSSPASASLTQSGYYSAGVICNFTAPSNTSIELVGGNNTKEGNVLLNGSPVW